MRVWPSALTDLTQKYADRQSVALWYHDEEILFRIVKMQSSNGISDRIELSGVTNAGMTVTVVIYIGSETDMVELNFYSTG